MTREARADDALDALAHVTSVPPPLPAALEAELGTLAPVAPRRPLRQLAIVGGLSLAYGGGLLAVLGLRRDHAELPTGWLLAVAVAWLLGFALPCYLALVPRAGTMLPRWQWAAMSAVVTAIGFVALGLVVHPSGPTSLQLDAASFVRGHWCLELGVATALVPVIAGALCLRGALPVRSRTIAAALGAGGGCLGGLVLHLHCRITDALHVGLMHGGVVAVSALLAASLVPRATDRPLA